MYIVLRVFCRFCCHIFIKIEFSRQIFKKFQILIFMKIHPQGKKTTECRRTNTVVVWNRLLTILKIGSKSTKRMRKIVFLTGRIDVMSKDVHNIPVSDKVVLKLRKLQIRFSCSSSDFLNFIEAFSGYIYLYSFIISFMNPA